MPPSFGYASGDCMLHFIMQNRLMEFFRVLFFVDKIENTALSGCFALLFQPIAKYLLKYRGFHEKGALSYLCALGIDR